MQGASGTYAFNGTSLTLQPSTGRWIQRTALGIDGSGHSIYPSTREFELAWDLISISDLQQINNAYNAVGNTGTLVADLPKYGDSQYNFLSYSGVTLQEPTYDVYFERYVQNVKLLIMNIRTT